MDYSVLIEEFRPFARLLFILFVLVFIGILLDYLTGTLAAKRNNEWSSKIAREGIWHKVGIIIAILLAVLLDIVVIVASRSLLQIQLSFCVFSPLVSLCYVITEFGSILENLRKMGTEVPAILIRGFASLKHSVNAHANAAVPESNDVPKEPDKSLARSVVEHTEPPDEEDWD